VLEDVGNQKFLAGLFKAEFVTAYKGVTKAQWSRRWGVESVEGCPSS